MACFSAERNAGDRRGQECRAAAGEQAEAEIVGTERAETISRIFSAPTTPSAVGSLTPAGRAGWRWMSSGAGRACRGTQSAGTLSQPWTCLSARTFGPRAASRPAAIPAPALPAPTTAIVPMEESCKRFVADDEPVAIDAHVVLAPADRCAPRRPRRARWRGRRRGGRGSRAEQGKVRWFRVSSTSRHAKADIGSVS